MFCVLRWTVGGPRNLRGTQSCQSVLLHPTLRPTPRLGLRTHRPRSVPAIIPGTFYSHVEIIFYHLQCLFFNFFFFFRVWCRTPSQHSTCPCSRSKSWHTRSAPTRGPHPWTGPRKTSSSATYRTSGLVHRFYSKWFTQLIFFFIIITTLAIL